MIKYYNIIILLFVITSCASNTSISKNNYDSVWIKNVKGKSVKAPNGYIYTFKEDGNVEYKINGIKGGTGIFLYAESSTNAFYYEKMPLNYIANDIKDNIPKSNINMFVSFIIADDKLKMSSGYKKEYYTRLSDWKKNNLTIYNTLRNGKDMSEYPIPYIDEIDINNSIEFGILRK